MIAPRAAPLGPSRSIVINELREFRANCGKPWTGRSYFLPVHQERNINRSLRSWVSTAKMAERVEFEPLGSDLPNYQQSKALRLLVSGLELQKSAASFVYLKAKT